MPGVFGLITRMPSERAVELLRTMLGVVGHEKFYRTGTHVDESLGVYIGWAGRPESIVTELGVAGTDATVIFDGELFQTELGNGRRGHSAIAQSIVRAYREDPDFPAGLNGRFHGIVIDPERRTAKLFNDRYGIHRLYFYETHEGVYFSAESKAILAVCPETRTLDLQSVGEFLSCGCVLDNRTLFKGVRVLPGGSQWVFRPPAAPLVRSYFTPSEWESQSTLEPSEYYDQLRSVFARALPAYFDSSRAAVGMSLTGGLDTRMIMAWYRGAPGSLPCYTYGSMYRESRDVTVARRVADASRQPFSVLHAGRGFLRDFHHYAERAVYLTDATVTVAHAPDLYLSEQARQVAPVRMTGLYGSEVLRQVRAFKPTRLFSDVFSDDLRSWIPVAADTYRHIVAGHPLSFAVFRQAPWHHYGPLTIEQTQLSVRSPFLDNEVVKTVFRAPPASLASNDVSLRLIGDGSRALRKIRTDRGVGGPSGRVTNVISRNALEFLFKAEYAYDYGMPHGLAQVDRLLSPLRLERLFLGRHKPYHFRIWYRDFLTEYVREILLDRKTLQRPYLQGNILEGVVMAHIKGSANYTTELHKLLTLELAHRLFIDVDSRVASPVPVHTA